MRLFRYHFSDLEDAIPGPKWKPGRTEDRARRPWHGPGLLILITLISGLNILDSVFTLMILDLGAVEANPIVGSAIELLGHHFWVWKYGIVSVGLMMLAYGRKGAGVIISLASIALVYSSVVIYEIAFLGGHWL